VEQQRAGRKEAGEESQKYAPEDDVLPTAARSQAEVRSPGPLSFQQMIGVTPD